MNGLLEALTSTVFLVALGLWLGGVVFFSFFTAPVIFRLPRHQAVETIQAIFPRYYALGYTCGFLMICAALYPLYRQATIGTWSIVLLALAATVVSFYSGQWVLPKVHRLRLAAEGSLGTSDHSLNLQAYSSAHGLSVSLNALVLLILLGEAVLFAYRVRYDFAA